MILDVGCGSSPKGHVNLDIERQCARMHTFVLADAEHLPFKNGSFETVYSSHVVEHVCNPRVMIKELLRVSKNKVIVKTPHLWSYASRGLLKFNKLTGFTYHLHSWTSEYWNKLLAYYEHVIKIKPNLHTPLWFIPFKSIEMIIEVTK